eukprot:g26290.t1
MEKVVGGLSLLTLGLVKNGRGPYSIGTPQFLWDIRKNGPNGRSLTLRSLSPTEKPSVHIYMEQNGGPGHSDILYCYAEKFYPFGIELNFLVNGRPFRGQVNSSQLVVEPDWTFNILKYIRMERGSGDTYTCRVDHISLQQPLTVSLG